MRLPSVVVTCVIGAVAVHAGCVSGECSTGTVRFGDTCVAVDPFDKTAPKLTVDPPLHTREVGIVRIAADERAVIYYTIDGSEPTLESANEPDQVVIANIPDDVQLRYFAIDLAGNRSAEESRIWVIDREGPAAPIDFKLALAGSTRNISYTTPPDPRYGGVLLARVEGLLDAPPEPGKSYVAGDLLSPGVTVMQVIDTTGPVTFTETRPAIPGLVRYVAYAFDNLHNYGPPAGDYALVPVPPQTGRITITGGGTVTQDVAPGNLTFTGTATLAGSTLTAKVNLRNDTSRVLFAPKVLVTNTPGVTWSNSDGTFATFPYKAYGAAILPGTVATASFVFTGANAGTSVSLDLDIRNNQVFSATAKNSASAGNIIDTTNGVNLLTLAQGVTGQGGSSQTQRGGITPDGRLIVGARTSGSVSSFDLATGRRIVVTTLQAPKSHVPQVILDKSGSAAYAIVVTGHPNNVNNNGSGGSESVLVRLDAATLAESGRLPLEGSRNRDMNLSPDGNTLLIATGVTPKGVILVDLPTFTIKSRLLPGFRVQCAMFSPDGNSIVAVGEQIAVFSVDDGTKTASYTTPGSINGGKVVRATFAGPNTLWIGRRNELANLDLRTGTSQLVAGLGGRMLEVFDSKIYAATSNTVTRLDETGVVETTLTGFTSLRGHWIGRSPF